MALHVLVEMRLFRCMLMPVRNPKADETERLRVGADCRVLQPQERLDFAFINPSLWHTSFSAVIEYALFWNIQANVHTNI